MHIKGAFLAPKSPLLRINRLFVYSSSVLPLPLDYCIPLGSTLSASRFSRLFRYSYLYVAVLQQRRSYFPPYLAYSAHVVTYWKASSPSLISCNSLECTRARLSSRVSEYSLHLLDFLPKPYGFGAYCVVIQSQAVRAH